MSHSIITPLAHAAARRSWEPVPSLEDEVAVDASGQTVRGEMTARGAGERDGLLGVSADVSRRQSVASMSSRSSLGDSGGAFGAAKPDGYFDTNERHILTPWLPYTLRQSYLAPLGILALVLVIVLAVLCAYSLRHDGLGADNGSVGVFVARRYVPTIIAVLITLAITMIADDVKRTEAFARMASRQPVTADHTLFYSPKVWWKSTFHALSRSRNGGHRSWILSLSSLAAGISVLAISTLSSSVFVTKEVLLRSSTQLQRYVPQQNGSISLLPRRDTYTRAISGFLYNASTSLWVSDSHVILPFFTPSEGLGRRVLQEGTWEAETMVLKMDSTCVPMNLIEKTELNITYSSFDSVSTARNGTFRQASRGLKLQSADGCEVQLQTPVAPSFEKSGARIISNPIDPYFTDTLSLGGGMMWTNLSSSHISWKALVEEHGQEPPIDAGGSAVNDQWRRTFIYEMSNQCQGRDLLFVSLPWFGPSVEEALSSSPKEVDEYWATFTARAELCSPRYLAASIPVTAVIGNATSRVFFDEAEFSEHQQPVSAELLDMDRLNNLTFSDVWKKYLSAPAGIQNIQGFEGLSMLLAKTYSLDLDSLLHNSSVPDRAKTLRSRFFSELISSSVLETDLPTVGDIAGKHIRAENRIVVVPGVSIALAVILLLAAFYSFAMLWYASNRQRPLNIDSDPAALAGAVPLTSIASPLAAGLRTWTQPDRTEIQQKIGSQAYALHNGTIRQQELDSDGTTTEIHVASSAKGGFWPAKRSAGIPSIPDWRPSMLRKTWLTCLLLSVVAIAIALLVLRDYAKREALFQTAFVQQINFSALHASFSPHALITTLIAVLVSLSWDSIDKAMRILQPYLALSKEPLQLSEGVAVSYQSSYWLWASVKAARSKHWLLCLVTLGTTLSQILVISMAAIFERQSIIHNLPTNFEGLVTTRLVQPRQEPFDFGINLSRRPFYLTDSLLGTSNADWLYTALDDVTLGTTPLPWTRDEWVFTPVNLTNRDDPSILYVASGAQGEAQGDAAYIISSFNVSLSTSGLRSRLECEPVELAGSQWLEDVQDVYPNRLDKSVTGHVLPMTLSTVENFAAPVFSVPRRIACCTNDTDRNSPSIVAYWSSNNSIHDDRPYGVGDVALDPNEDPDVVEPSGWSKTFAIKWIVGSAASTLIPGTDPNSFGNSFGIANESVLYFREEPQISILKCNPIIEQVNASITLSRDSTQILDYELLDTPQPAAGAWDYAYDVVYSTPGSNRSEGNVSYGAYFLSQLLTAPNIVVPDYASSMMVFNQTLENLDAERFTLRDNDKGTNMDFMSYSNFVLSNKNATALLDPATSRKHSEQTFQTFFKHFATTANWTYGGPLSVSRAAYEDIGAFDRTSERFQRTITERIEILSMNEVATWLSLTILFLLMAILVTLIVAFQTIYPRTSMLRHVECLADVLAMVAGSDELVRLVNEIGVEGMEKAGIKTRLGWFRDKRGVVRWGVEVVNENVSWVDGPDEGQDKKEGVYDLPRALRLLAPQFSLLRRTSQEWRHESKSTQLTTKSRPYRTAIRMPIQDAFQLPASAQALPLANNATAELFLCFIASTDPATSQPWCPDVRAALPRLEKVFSGADAPELAWKDLENVYRTKWDVKALPQLVRFQRVGGEVRETGRLVENEVNDDAKLLDFVTA
ncbi:hypothetical protein OPT61_g2973 [Boeremia exigua]|uniref:Uncharacterized protein n=1 Tax=Boeremia exigua TaxID=749465 RepID=A0ACC2IJV5_9PLEO|nr:hypothetical protein OPT61_g2973 [Boeremia exigua]